MQTKNPITTILAALGVLALGGATTLAACTGPTGPEGQAGANGEAGPMGPPGPAGASDAGPIALVEGGLQASCMSPCHGFNGIVEQWKSSTHYFGAIVNVEEQVSWTSPNSACGNCHATDGLPSRLAGQGTLASGSTVGPTNYKLGQLNYTKATGGVAELGYGGHAPLAIIGCTSCHDTVTNDPHVTGALYKKGDFKLRVPSGPNDQAYLEKSPTVGTVTGTPAGKWGVNNTCIQCHKSRKDVTNYITASNAVTNAYWGPHEGPHADVFSGVGGYHFTGKTYTSSAHQTTSGCGSCHMPKVALNGNYPDHSFRPQLSSCTSSGCHAPGTINSELATSRGVFNGALQDLQRVLNNRGFLTRDTLASAPLGAAELADKQFNIDRSRNPGAPLTADEAGALYDYLLVARGGALGAHNPLYTKQLIFDAYVAVRTGADPATPATIPVRP